MSFKLMSYFPPEKYALRIAIGVALVHILILLCSLIPGIRGMSLADSLWASDQSTYITDARAMLKYGAFTRENMAPFLWEPYRTPGLPVIIFLSLLVFHSLLPVLFVNVIFAGLAAYFGCRLLLLFTTDKSMLVCFGALLALLPNVLGTDCYVLTDSLFSYLGLIWIYFFIRSVKFQKFQDILIASACLAFAQLTKPTLSVACILIVLMFLFLYWKKWNQVNYVQFVLMLVLSVAAPLYLSLKMYQSHGIFTPTLLGEETKREYLIANYLADRTGKDYYQIQQEIRMGDKMIVDQMPPSGKSYYGTLYTYKKQQNDSLTKADPIGLSKVFIWESIKQLVAPQEAIFGVFSPTIPKGWRIFGAMLNLTILCLVATGCYVLYQKKLYSYILIACMFYSFYIAAGSMSSRQGGRFRLPADVMVLPVAAVGLHLIMNGKKKSQQSK